MIPAALVTWNFLLLSLSSSSSFPLHQRLINEASDVQVSPALGRHPLPTHLPPLLPLFHSHPDHPRKHYHRHHRKRIHWMKEALETANVEETGRLDRRTILEMRKPRCGNADILENDPQPEGEADRKKRFAQVSKWANKLDQNDVLSLKWHVQHYTNDIARNEIRRIVRRAFKLWEDQIGIPSMRTVQLNFSEARTPDDADINILWAKGDHGDAYPFDNGGDKTNILAHTFYPNYQETGSLNGDIHFDDFEKWVLDNSTADGVHFPYVLVHEIGHALGLGHSKRQEAVMNPIYKKFSLNLIVLDLDDKCAINWNYVGPTQTCLFVWLMVELLPIAKESNVTTHGIASVINITNAAPNQNNRWNHQTLEERLNYTLESLQEADIPQCTEENNVQSEYEDLLQRELAFPRKAAQTYGPVVCNFLDGLSRVVHRSSSRQRPSRTSRNVQHLTVHQYSQGSERPDFMLLESSTFDGEPRLRRRRSQKEDRFRIKRTSQNPDEDLREEQNQKAHFSQRNSNDPALVSSVFDRDFFDDGFYQKLLRLFVQQSR